MEPLLLPLLLLICTVAVTSTALFIAFVASGLLKIKLTPLAIVIAFVSVIGVLAADLSRPAARSDGSAFTYVLDNALSPSWLLARILWPFAITFGLLVIYKRKGFRKHS